MLKHNRTLHLPAEGHSTGGAGASPTVDRMTDSVHRVVDQLASKAGPAVERARSGMHHAMESMHEQLDNLSHTRDEVVEGCRNGIRKHPLTSIGIAVAAGYLLSRLMRDR